jgi:hypothetical protein
VEVERRRGRERWESTFWDARAFFHAKTLLSKRRRKEDY